MRFATVRALMWFFGVLVVWPYVYALMATNKMKESTTDGQFFSYIICTAVAVAAFVFFIQSTKIWLTVKNSTRAPLIKLASTRASNNAPSRTRAVILAYALITALFHSSPSAANIKQYYDTTLCA